MLRLRNTKCQYDLLIVSNFYQHRRVLLHVGNCRPAGFSAAHFARGLGRTAYSDALYSRNETEDFK